MKMTTITMILSLLLIGGVTASQNTYASGVDTKDLEISITDDSTKVYTMVDQMPQIIGGIGEVYKQIRYPQIALTNRTEGKVFVQFVVNENGEVENPKVLKDIGHDCGNAAIEAIQKVKFTPGVLNGDPVAVSYTLPVTFRIGN